MITVETVHKYPKVEFTFFDENKYLNGMRFNKEREISKWEIELKKIEINTIPTMVLRFRGSIKRCRFIILSQK